MSPAIKKVLKIIKLVLNLSNKVNDFIPYAKSIYNKMKNNVRYAALSSKLAELEDAIKILNDEQTLCTVKPPIGNFDTRNSYLEAVKMILRDLGNSVQIMANADIVNAETIITSSGFSVKKTGGGRPQRNTVENGPTEDSILCIAAGRGLYNWRISRDNINFEIQLASKSITAIFYGFVPGEIIYVQNSAVLKNAAEGKWSQSIKFRVK